MHTLIRSILIVFSSADSIILYVFEQYLSPIFGVLYFDKNVLLNTAYELGFM